MKPLCLDAPLDMHCDVLVPPEVLRTLDDRAMAQYIKRQVDKAFDELHADAVAIPHPVSISKQPWGGQAMRFESKVTPKPGWCFIACPHRRCNPANQADAGRRPGRIIAVPSQIGGGDTVNRNALLLRCPNCHGQIEWSGV